VINICRNNIAPSLIPEITVQQSEDGKVMCVKIRLNLYSDKLEIFSPGKLPKTLNLTRALSGISYYRNPIIAQMVKDYGFAEKAGRGLRKIVKLYESQSIKSPVFDDDPTYFKVTLYRN